MRIGVSLPQRERGMGTDVGAIRDFAQSAESLGYDHLRTGDHVRASLAAFGSMSHVTTTPSSGRAAAII